MATSQILPDHSYALQVQWSYMERVRRALVSSSVSEANHWTAIEESSASVYQEFLQPHLPHGDGCTVIHEPLATGPRKSRRGCAYMVVRGAKRSPSSLLCIARQNIFWAGRVTNAMTSSSAARSSNDMFYAAIAEAYEQLIEKHNFTFEKHALRMDVRPKSREHEAFQLLEKVAKLGVGFSPDKVVRSASKCTHVLNLVCSVGGDAGEEVIYWGLSSRDEHWKELNGMLNGYASPQIENWNSLKAKGDAPSSRAYYKLDQAFDEYLRTHIGQLSGAGLDLGSSPGGWTQVLHKHGLNPVLSVDRAVLAPRVEGLSGVEHVKHSYDDKEAILRMASAAPFSAIVCDANTLCAEVQEDMAKVMRNVSIALTESPSSGKPLFIFPAIFVLTLKLPYKSTVSIQTNMKKAIEKTPDCLRQIAAAGTSTLTSKDEAITVNYRIVHLDANSESERTLIAVFDRVAKTQQ